jgi:hypothetical protein
MYPASVLVDDLPSQEWKLRHYGVSVELVTVGEEDTRVRLGARDAEELYYALLDMAALVSAHVRHPSARGES